MASAGGTFFGSPNNPRIVRLSSTPVEIPTQGIVLLVNNRDVPGIVGKIGTVLARHQVNIASMSLGREVAGGQALTALTLDSVPPAGCLEDLKADGAITHVQVVTL